MLSSLKPMYWTIFICFFFVECRKSLRINHERRGAEAVQLTSDLNPAKLGFPWQDGGFITSPPPEDLQNFLRKIKGSLIFVGIFFSCSIHLEMFVQFLWKKSLVMVGCGHGLSVAVPNDNYIQGSSKWTLIFTEVLQYLFLMPLNVYSFYSLSS